MQVNRIEITKRKERMVNELVHIQRNEVFTDSLVIAKGTNNQHKTIKRLITNYKNDIKSFGTLGILNRQSTGGRPEQIYQLNEQQATFLMTLLRNNKIVVQFKKDLVKQFYQMRQLLLQKQTQEWQTTRYQGKLTRKSETDIIQELIEYAKNQGSKNSGKLYVVYSKLANKTAGVEKRDLATVIQLNNLSLIENIILHVVKAGMEQDKHYKEIYKDSKKKLEQFLEISYLLA